MKMQRWFFVLLLSVIFLVACDQKPKEKKEQASYAVGMQFGKSLRMQKVELDTGYLVQGLKDGYEGKKSLLDHKEATVALSHLGDERREKAKALAEKNKAEAKAYLERNKSLAGVRVTASGLQYKILSPGSGPSPTLDDSVQVNYRGTLVDGTEFDSNAKAGVPAEFPLRQVIPGWSEGLRLMKKGSRAILYVPPELAYGDRERGKIPPASVLIFEVELLNIVSAKKPAPIEFKKPAVKSSAKPQRVRSR